LSVCNHKRHRGNDEPDAPLLGDLDGGTCGEEDVVIGGSIQCDPGLGIGPEMGGGRPGQGAKLMPSLAQTTQSPFYSTCVPGGYMLCGFPAQSPSRLAALRRSRGIRG
jgi:hypothetical protein